MFTCEHHESKSEWDPYPMLGMPTMPTLRLLLGRPRMAFSLATASCLRFDFFASCVQEEEKERVKEMIRGELLLQDLSMMQCMLILWQQEILLKMTWVID